LAAKLGLVQQQLTGLRCAPGTPAPLTPPANVIVRP
jgi:hypothetical protein